MYLHPLSPKVRSHPGLPDNTGQRSLRYTVGPCWWPILNTAVCTCWSWNSSPLATWCKELTHRRNPDAGKDWAQEEKGTTEDKMVGWHHQLTQHWVCASSGRWWWTGKPGVLQCMGHKGLNTTERLNWYFKTIFKKWMTRAQHNLACCCLLELSG